MGILGPSTRVNAMVSGNGRRSHCEVRRVCGCVCVCRRNGSDLGIADGCIGSVGRAHGRKRNSVKAILSKLTGKFVVHDWILSVAEAILIVVTGKTNMVKGCEGAALHPGTVAYSRSVTTRKDAIPPFA